MSFGIYTYLNAIFIPQKCHQGRTINAEVTQVSILLESKSLEAKGSSVKSSAQLNCALLNRRKKRQLVAMFRVYPSRTLLFFIAKAKSLYHNIETIRKRYALIFYPVGLRGSYGETETLVSCLASFVSGSWLTLKSLTALMHYGKRQNCDKGNTWLIQKKQNQTFARNPNPGGKLVHLTSAAPNTAGFHVQNKLLKLSGSSSSPQCCKWAEMQAGLLQLLRHNY